MLKKRSFSHPKNIIILILPAYLIFRKPPFMATTTILMAIKAAPAAGIGRIPILGHPRRNEPLAKRSADSPQFSIRVNT